MSSSVPSASHPALVRLEWLVVALEKLPAAQRRFQASLLAVLEATRGVKLLGEIGLPNNRGLLAETTDRLVELVDLLVWASLAITIISSLHYIWHARRIIDGPVK